MSRFSLIFYTKGFVFLIGGPMKKSISLSIIALLLSGCASSPSDLGTAYVPVATYAKYDCEQLIAETGHINHRLGELYSSLEKKASNDNIQMGVGLILFWPLLFALEGGDGPEAVEYSRLKGEYEAIRGASIAKKCSLDSIPEFKTPEDHKEEVEAKQEHNG